MQFQETKAREIELMENSKDKTKLHSSRPLDTVVKFMQKLCNCKPQGEQARVHHHHHHFYHHHHFHHHLYNCFVPASPGMLSNSAHDSAFFPPPDIPQIKVEKEGMSFSSNDEESAEHQDFLAPAEQTPRRSSKTSVCSHTLSIHAETSSAVSIDEILAQTKTRVTLNIPSPTAPAGFFAFATSNSASRKNSGTGKAEVSTSTTVLAEINPKHAIASKFQEKEIQPTIENKEKQKPSIRRKDKELLKHRRFSQPAHVKLTRTISPSISTYSPSQMFDKDMNLGDSTEVNPEQLQIAEALSSSTRNTETNDTEREITFKDFATERRDNDCQPVVAGSKGKSSAVRRNISTQSEDDMFESLFNLRQSASYDVTVNQGIWQRLRASCRKVIVSTQFTFLIMGVILLNMICMGLEHYNQVGIMYYIY